MNYKAAEWRLIAPGVLVNRNRRLLVKSCGAAVNRSGAPVNVERLTINVERGTKRDKICGYLQNPSHPCANITMTKTLTTTKKQRSCD